MTLNADLPVHLFPPFPPIIPEASQTRIFYTAYEMFEGHRKRKWAWFPVSGWTLQQRLPLPLRLTHASTNICICICICRPGQPASSHVATRRSVPLVANPHCWSRGALRGFYMSITGSQLPLWAPSLQKNVHVDPAARSFRRAAAGGPTHS